MTAVERLFIPAVDRKLEALLSLPASPGRKGFVLCHPYPPYGGDMFNKVMVKLTQWLLDRNYLVLRYNMAGTGRSTGAMQEPNDARSDLETVCRWFGDNRELDALWLAGYSYGAYLALSSQVPGTAGAFVPDTPLKGILAIACPCTVPEFRMERLPEIPLVFVQAREDELIPAHAAADYLRAFRSVRKVAWVEGANHTFNGTMDALLKACADCLPELTASC